MRTNRLVPDPTYSWLLSHAVSLLDGYGREVCCRAAFAAPRVRVVGCRWWGGVAVR
jgi:hypothetical protein